MVVILFLSENSDECRQQADSTKREGQRKYL